MYSENVIRKSKCLLSNYQPVLSENSNEAQAIGMWVVWSNNSSVAFCYRHSAFVLGRVRRYSCIMPWKKLLVWATGQIEWLVNIALPIDYYPRGAGWQRNNNLDPWFNSPATEDYWFRTYVSPVPEPSVFALLGLSSFVWLRRRLNRSNSGGR
jgi:hypothetical protein